VTALLEIRDLAVAFRTARGDVPALVGVSLAVRTGETVALVGESGCGKTLTALAVMGLLPAPARVHAGEVRFRGRDLLALDAGARRAVNGSELALSFQEPASALNPVLRAGAQVAEGLRHHGGLSRLAAHARALALFAEVGLEPPDELARRYPHELSGGQRQRVMLALALACGPSLLIADEPTSALDAPVQVEIVRLLRELVARREMALLLITHDLGLVRALCTRVAVMYAGRIVEEGRTADVLAHASHPYTQGLLAARAPLLAAQPGTAARFHAIPGQVPALGAWPSGCPFRPRCPRADDVCAHEDPSLLPVLRPDDPARRAAAAGERYDVAQALRGADPSLQTGDQRVACHHPGAAP
jgi:peptide/nickel transport system ATP-binding protein